MAASPSDALVLFGATGDLAHKMILPALYAMVKIGVLTAPVIAVALRNCSRLRVLVNDCLIVSCISETWTV
jgi:glucose-6-phosphate 1-dehydrogenase